MQETQWPSQQDIEDLAEAATGLASLAILLLRRRGDDPSTPPPMTEIQAMMDSANQMQTAIQKLVVGNQPPP